MLFRTVITPEKAPFDIDHQDRILLIGSCFTEHIGHRLRDQKFSALINPFGIVYNPFSMAQCLEMLLDNAGSEQHWNLFEYQGLWHSWLHHGKFSDSSPEKTLDNIQKSFEIGSAFLKKTTHIILTLGTADVFRLVSDQSIVANNHKMPSALFRSERLTVSSMSDQLTAVLRRVKAENPDLKIIFSVSPIRHLRQGVVENQRSKATLVLAIEQILSDLPDSCYFPAYELLLDDLRDYRFYTDDMIHPSTVAQDYIWKFFSTMFFSESTQVINERIKRIVTASQHRPFHADTPLHQQFLSTQLKAIDDLRQTNPHLDFSRESSLFESGMVK